MTKFVRIQDDNGDPIFGRGEACFAYGAQSVPQRLKTRLQLILGEWFLNADAGVPWWQPEGSDNQPIMGVKPIDRAYAESVIKARILSTDGVQSLDAFSMQFDSQTRRLAVVFTVTAVDDPTTPVTGITVTPPVSVPVPSGSFSMGAIFTVDFAVQLRTLPNMASYVTGQTLVHADDVDADYWLKANTGNPDNLDPPGDGKYITAADGRQFVRS